MLLLSSVILFAAVVDSATAQYEGNQPVEAHIGQLDLAAGDTMLSRMLAAQIGSAGSLDMEDPEHKLLGEFLAWTPQIQADCLTGTVHADTPLLGTDLLSIAVLLGRQDAVDMLIDSMPAPIPPDRLDSLLSMSLGSMDYAMARQLLGRGASMDSAGIRQLAEHTDAAAAHFLAELLEDGWLASAAGDWTASLVAILPYVDNAQLDRLLAQGTHWQYDQLDNVDLLGACMRDSGKFQRLLDAGLDLPAALQGQEEHPLVAVCRAYREQRRLTELQAASVGNARLELALRGLAFTCTELLEQLDDRMLSRGGLDERLPELGLLTGEEYVVCSAVPDPRFYRRVRRLGLDLNATDGDGNNALNLLAVQGRLSPEELLALSEMGMDPLLENFLSRSALHAVILDGRDGLATAWLDSADTAQLKALVAMGRIDEFDSAVAALEEADGSSDRELEKGMLLAAQSGRRESLEAVIAAGHAPLMQALVMLGMEDELGKAFFDQNLLIKENLTVDSCLTVAVKQRNLKLLAFLFSVLPHDQHWIEESQDQALLEAARCEDRRYMQALLDYGTPVERSSAGGLTALVSACGAGLTDNVRFLLQQGADPGRGLDYFRGRKQMPADELAAAEECISILLEAWNPSRPGLAADWSGYGGNDNAASLLTTMIGWQSSDPQLLGAVAAVSSAAVRRRGMLDCIAGRRAELLAVIMLEHTGNDEPQLERELLTACLRSASPECLELLLGLGANLAPAEAVKILSVRD